MEFFSKSAKTTNQLVSQEQSSYIFLGIRSCILKQVNLNPVSIMYSLVSNEEILDKLLILLSITKDSQF